MTKGGSVNQPHPNDGSDGAYGRRIFAGPEAVGPID